MYCWLIEGPEHLCLTDRRKGECVSIFFVNCFALIAVITLIIFCTHRQVYLFVLIQSYRTYFSIWINSFVSLWDKPANKAGAKPLSNFLFCFSRFWQYLRENVAEHTYSWENEHRWKSKSSIGRLDNKIATLLDQKRLFDWPSQFISAINQGSITLLVLNESRHSMFYIKHARVFLKYKD